MIFKIFIRPHLWITFLGYLFEIFCAHYCIALSLLNGFEKYIVVSHSKFESKYFTNLLDLRLY